MPTDIEHLDPATTGVTAAEERSSREFAGLDALEVAEGPRASRLRHLWSLTWPKLAAIAIGLFLWQCVVWSGWKPEYLLPGSRGRVLDPLGLHPGGSSPGSHVDHARSGRQGLRPGPGHRRGRSAAWWPGSRCCGWPSAPSSPASRPCRRSPGSPWRSCCSSSPSGRSCSWSIIGAAPSIANGLIAGSDNIPPILLRAGQALGARGFSSYRHIVLPASLPYFVGGMKQGWAFAWRSLMAGELLVVIAGRESIGVLLQTNRNLSERRGPAGHDDRHPRDRDPGRQPDLRHPRPGHPAPLGSPRPRRLILARWSLTLQRASGTAGSRNPP